MRSTNVRPRTNPAVNLNDPALAHATKIIEAAIRAACAGGDSWLCAAGAARDILGGIASEAVHRYSGCEPGPWKRMPPALREAIAKATGSKS